MKFKYHDGGRSSAGYSIYTKDCVTRAISLLLDWDYLNAYEYVNKIINKVEKKKVSHATIGIANNTTKKIFSELGLKWIKTNKIPSRLKKPIILNMVNHVCFAKNGEVFDTHDYFKINKRIYGYWLF
jgi:hypothetical protein